MPGIQNLYEVYGFNEEDVIILGVASPKSQNNLHNKEQDQEGVIRFLETNGYTYPTVMDTEGWLEAIYGITAYPMTYMIDTKDKIYGYLPGMMYYEIIESIIEQTKKSSE